MFSTFRNFVFGLLSRGNNRRQIFQKVKTDSRFKRSSNSAIDNAIKDSKKSIDAGPALSKLKKGEEIRKSLSGRVGKNANMQVGYRFAFDFPEDAQSEKRGTKASAYFTIDVKGGMTKEDLIKKIMDQIQDWVDRHYETSNRRSIRQTLKFLSVRVF